jgi:ArsR family transcriptional regulator, arsenate/arsenite/antimonite-responsive transcriptional repressor
MTSINDSFKALADPTRREILNMLKAGEMSAGEIAEHFDMTKPTLSHHFSILKEAGLIDSRKEAQTIWYSLNTSVLEDLASWALNLADNKRRKK